MLLISQNPKKLVGDGDCTTAATGFDKPADKKGRAPAGFHDLPPEIHMAISKHLIYPDALSLKHTCRYLYMLVDTGVHLKIDWLIERRSLHLECPNDRRCDLGSDLKFCRGSVRLLMQRRREHLECESRPGLGCLVYGTTICTHRRKLSERWKRWLRARMTVEIWWVAAGVAIAMVAWYISLVTLGGMPTQR